MITFTVGHLLPVRQLFYSHTKRLIPKIRRTTYMYVFRYAVYVYEYI